VGPSHASIRKQEVCIWCGDRRCKSVAKSWRSGSRPRAMAANRKLAYAKDTVGEAVNAHPSSTDRQVVGFRTICGKEENTNAAHHIGRIVTTADPTRPLSPSCPTRQTIGSPVDRPVQASTPCHPSHPLLIHLTEKFGSGYPRKTERKTSKLKRWGRTLSSDRGGKVEGRARTGQVATSTGPGVMEIAQGASSRRIGIERTYSRMNSTTYTP